MGSGVAEATQALQCAVVKVHRSMCRELTRVLNGIICIVPAIESARPGCMSGIQELCSLNNTIEKAKLLLQHCAESSKLYLAITAEATVLRCERIQNSLDRSLCQIQNMVPQLLANEIAKIVNGLRDAKFMIDSSEEEAGRAILALLGQRESTEDTEFRAFSIAAWKLNITSPKDLLVESRSLKKLLDKFCGADPKKERIVNYLLYLLMKYGRKVRTETCDHKENVVAQNKGSVLSTNKPCNGSLSENIDDPTEAKLQMGFSCGESQTDLSDTNVPPEKFRCPISRRQYDPVIIDYVHGDHSNVSVLSSDGSFSSDSSHVKGIENLKDDNAQIFSWSDDYLKYQSFSNFSHDMYLSFLSKLSELPLEYHSKALEDVKILLNSDDEAFRSMLPDHFVKALIRFLKDSCDLSNVRAKKTGAQILLALLSNSRVEIPSLDDDAIQFLISFLDYEITAEALMIMQILSCHPSCKSSIVSSSVLFSIIKILDAGITDILELAVKVLCDLSSNSEIGFQILSSGCIMKLVPLLNDSRYAGHCIKTLRNLCDIEGGGAIIVETSECLASIAEILDTGNIEEQEHAVAVLLSLCSSSFGNSLLVMKEGVIPSLVNISINGNPPGKESSMKLLHLLRDLRYSDYIDGSLSNGGSILESI